MIGLIVKAISVSYLGNYTDEYELKFDIIGVSDSRRPGKISFIRKQWKFE
jgi:hypothetical protein